MNASYEWLRAFVPFDMSPTELRDLLTSRCATVDDLVSFREDLRDVVIGRVVEVKKHPNSDHLWLTKVDAGGGTLLDVVCGAANVSADTLYPFAPVGAVLPGGLKIEKKKIRGETSEGMLCSAKELGLGQDHEGIMALTVTAEPGSKFLQAMPIGDTCLVIDVLPNRPDLLSHEGLAREIAAATGGSVTRPE
ncbi:MAG: phenylalanine--tRNA ligase subunit beta, partial [Gemmatimonadetes bacterium]